MIKAFKIKTGKRTLRFDTVTAMEAYINEHKATLMRAVIYLIDENNVSIGAIKVSSYVKNGK